MSGCTMKKSWQANFPNNSLTIVLKIKNKVYASGIKINTKTNPIDMQMPMFALLESAIRKFKCLTKVK